ERHRGPVIALTDRGPGRAHAPPMTTQPNTTPRRRRRSRLGGLLATTAIAAALVGPANALAVGDIGVSNATVTEGTGGTPPQMDFTLTYHPDAGGADPAIVQAFFMTQDGSATAA